MRLRVTSTVISLLPALAIIPVGIEIIQNLHWGGMDIFFSFFTAAFRPSIDQVILNSALKGLRLTISTALISWSISIILGLILGILSSKIFSKVCFGNNWLSLIFKNILALPRSIHELIWGLILLQILGLNPIVAILAMIIPYSSMVAKVISNQLDTLKYDSLFAIKQSGVNGFTAFFTALFPPITPILITYFGYRLECALRSATLLGVFGLGGIGTELQLTLQSLKFNEMWTSLWLLFIVMFTLERSLNLLREKNISWSKLQRFRHRNFALFFILILLAFSFLDVVNLKDIKELKFYPISFASFDQIVDEISLLPLFDLIKSTLLLTILSAGIAIGIPPLGLLLSPEKLIMNLQAVLWIFLRLIPPPLMALLLLFFSTPSISLAALTLGLSNIGVMGRILKENIKYRDNSTHISIKSVGASSQVSFLYGKLTPYSKSYLSFAAYRAEIILRETAIVGIVGGVGLGWQLQESLSSFAWSQVILITVVYAGLTLTVEYISDQIREYLNKSTSDFSLCYSSLH